MKESGFRTVGLIKPSFRPCVSTKLGFRQYGLNKDKFRQNCPKKFVFRPKQSGFRLSEPEKAGKIADGPKKVRI